MKKKSKVKKQAKIQKPIKAAPVQAEKTQPKPVLQIILLSLIILTILFFSLYIWAASQIKINTQSADILNSVANFKYDLTATTTSAQSEITLTNPTFMPVYSSEITTELKYGDELIGYGNTGPITLNPHSSITTPVYFSISNLAAADVVLGELESLFKQSDKKLKMVFYANLGSIKFPIHTIG